MRANPKMRWEKLMFACKRGRACALQYKRKQAHRTQEQDENTREPSLGTAAVHAAAAAGVAAGAVGTAAANKAADRSSAEEGRAARLHAVRRTESNESNLSDETLRQMAAQRGDVDDSAGKRLALAEAVDPDLKNSLIEVFQSASKKNAQEKQRQAEETFGNVFDVLDADSGGTLEVDGELLQTMQKLGLEIILKDLRIGMEKVVQRKHDRVERVGMFQKRLVWDHLFKEEFIKVMVLMTEPETIAKQKEAEEQLFQVFQEFDADKSGSIDCEELGKALEKMGKPMTDDQIENLMIQIDSEGTGAINFVDFASIFGIKATDVDYTASARADMLSQLAEARATFKTFDFDQSNTIDMNELDAIMRAMGRKLSEQQLIKMMQTVDTDGSGEIEFPEFCTLLGIEWNEQFGLDLKEIDAFSKANRPKDVKKKQSVSHDDSAPVDVNSNDDNAPIGMRVVSDPSGFQYVKYSPNGNLVGVCCNDGSIKIFEMKRNGKARRVSSLREHTHHALSLAWSPTSDRLISVAADRMLHMWHIKTGTCVQSAKAHSAYVRAVAWSNDGTMIATCSSDKTVKMWNPITLEQTKLMLGHSNWVRFVRFRGDSKRLVSGGDDNFMIIWTVPEGQILQRIAGFKSAISDACFLSMPQYRLPPLVTSELNGNISIWHPDVGLHGFMHYTIVGIDALYPSPSTMTRYIIFEIGRNRHSLKTRPVHADSLDYESDTDKMISCSVWDMNEVVRLQLFEMRENEPVRLMGEFSSTHKDLQDKFADGIQQRFNLFGPDGDKLTDGGEHMTFLRMKIRFEPMDHNANLNISVEEGKNMKHPEIKGPISTRVTVRTQRGQEYSTGVVINSKTPQWSQMFNFGIGPSTHEIDVSVDMIDPIERFAEELGAFQLRMDKLLSKVCSQQEPFSGWYVVRNEVDRKSRGSVRLKFTWSEAVKEAVSDVKHNPASGKYLGFANKLAGVRGEIGTFFTPRHHVEFMGHTLYRSTCRFCKQKAKMHSVEGRCQNTAENVGKQVVCISQSSDGVLLGQSSQILIRLTEQQAINAFFSLILTLYDLYSALQTQPGAQI